MCWGSGFLTDAKWVTLTYLSFRIISAICWIDLIKPDFHFLKKLLLQCHPRTETSCRKLLNVRYPKLVNFSSLTQCKNVFMIRLKVKGENQSPWRTPFFLQQCIWCESRSELLINQSHSRGLSKIMSPQKCKSLGSLSLCHC